MASPIIFDFVSRPEDDGGTGEQTPCSHNLARFRDLEHPIRVNCQVLNSGDPQVTAAEFVGRALGAGHLSVRPCARPLAMLSRVGAMFCNEVGELTVNNLAAGQQFQLETPLVASLRMKTQ